MAAAASNFSTPSWLSDPGMNNPAFDAFLQSIAQDRANYDPAFGFTNTPVSSLYQELGEGNQGQQLLKMFQGGLTADQVHNAYYGQYGGVDPAAVTALGSTDPSQLTGQMKTLYDQGLLQYTPAVPGDPGQTADTPASYSLAQPVTHFGQRSHGCPTAVRSQHPDGAEHRCLRLRSHQGVRHLSRQCAWEFVEHLPRPICADHG